MDFSSWAVSSVFSDEDDADDEACEDEDVSPAAVAAPASASSVLASVSSASMLSSADFSSLVDGCCFSDEGDFCCAAAEAFFSSVAGGGVAPADELEEAPSAVAEDEGGGEDEGSVLDLPESHGPEKQGCI